MLRYVCVAVLLCFIAGIIGANIMDKEQLDSFGIWNTYFIERFKYAHIQSMELFFYVLEQRLPVMILLLLFAFTGWGTAAGSVFFAWQGFAAGFLMAASVIAYGIKGLLLIGTAVFPQYLIYIPLYVAYIYLALFFKGRVKESRKEESGRMKEYALFISVSLLILSVYVTGIFLESYVNPYLLKKILKIF